MEDGVKSQQLQLVVPQGSTTASSETTTTTVTTSTKTSTSTTSTPASSITSTSSSQQTTSVSSPAGSPTASNTTSSSQSSTTSQPKNSGALFGFIPFVGFSSSPVGTAILIFVVGSVTSAPIVIRKVARKAKDKGRDESRGWRW